MQTYIQTKWSGCGSDNSTHDPKPQVPAGPEQVDSDMREIGAETQESPGGKRGQKRTAGETSASAQPAPKAAAAQQPQSSQAESAWRRAPGLRPAVTRPAVRQVKSPIKEPYHSTTCRACGGSQPGKHGTWCRCQSPQWYDRLVYPPGGRRQWEAREDP